MLRKNEMEGKKEKNIVQPVRKCIFQFGKQLPQSIVNFVERKLNMNITFNHQFIFNATIASSIEDKKGTGNPLFQFTLSHPGIFPGGLIKKMTS